VRCQNWMSGKYMFKHSFYEAIKWINDSISLFRQKPAMCMLLALSYVAIGITPAIGGLPIPIKLLAILSLPSFQLMVINFYLELDKGRQPRLAGLFNLIKPYIGKLVILGGICLVYSALASALTSSDLATLNTMMQDGSDNEAIATKFLPLMLKVLLLLAPLLMATWFAPMLIVHHQFSIFRAIKSSIAGSLYSALSLGIAWAILTLAFAVAMTLIGAVVAIVAAISQHAAEALASLILINCFLVATALMLAFQYVSYRDVFAKKFENLVKVDITA